MVEGVSSQMSEFSGNTPKGIKRQFLMANFSGEFRSYKSEIRNSQSEIIQPYALKGFG